MNRPVSAVGLLIMVAAAVVGFKPTLWSMLLFMATTIFGGHLIKKLEGKKVYDGFVILFGYMASGFCFIAGGMLWFAFELPWIDRISHSFLPIVAGTVIITLIKNQRNED